MKLTEELLQQMIMEELGSLGEDVDRRKKSKKKKSTKKTTKKTSSKGSSKGSSKSPSGPPKASAHAKGKATKAITALSKAKYKPLEAAYQTALGQLKAIKQIYDASKPTVDWPATYQTKINAAITKANNLTDVTATAKDIANIKAADTVLRKASHNALSTKQTTALKTLQDAFKMSKGTTATTKKIWTPADLKIITDAIDFYKALPLPPPITGGSEDFSVPAASVKAATGGTPLEKLKKIILKAFAGFGGKGKEIDTLAGLSEQLLNEVRSDLEWEDFEVILKNPTHRQHKNALRAFVLARNVMPTDPTYTAALKKLIDHYKGKGFTIDKHISTDQIKGAPRGDLADMYAGYTEPDLDAKGQPKFDAKGKPMKKGTRDPIPSYVVDIFNALNLTAAPTLKQRIELINNATKLVAEFDPTATGPTAATQTAAAKKYNIGQAISILTLQDMMSQIARNFDSKSAGWVFEHFLSQLANGTQEGAEYGAVDFQYGIPSGTGTDGVIGGSAKLLKGDAFKIDQAASTVAASLKNIGDKIIYIVGLKRSKTSDLATLYPSGQFGQKYLGPTAKQDEIKAVEVFLVTMEKTTGPNVKIDGGAPQAIKNGQFTFSPTAANRIGTIYLADSTAKLRENGEAVLKQINKDLPILYKQMETFRRTTNSYLTAGRADEGMTAATAYSNLFTSINDVFDAKANETGVDISLIGAKATVTRQDKLEENKTKAEKLLDKLIKEVILYR